MYNFYPFGRRMYIQRFVKTLLCFPAFFVTQQGLAQGSAINLNGTSQYGSATLSKYLCRKTFFPFIGRFSVALFGLDLLTQNINQTNSDKSVPFNLNFLSYTKTALSDSAPL